MWKVFVVFPQIAQNVQILHYTPLLKETYVILELATLLH